MKRLLGISVFIILTIAQANAYDFDALNNDGVRIYYAFQGGSGNRVMVVSREGIFPTYSGVVNIPESVTYEGVKYDVEVIGEGAFERCPELTEVILPPTIKTIRERAFSQCDKLKKINFPDKITSIRYRAFSNCSSLKTASFGDNLTEIGMSAFIQCTSLESISFGNKISLIDRECFYGCQELKNVILPESLTEIGEYAFLACALTNITIPNSVKTIGSNAFKNCVNMEQVVIGDNVSFIGRSAFSYCIGLKQFVVSGKNNKYSSENGMLVNKDKTTLVIFPGGKSISEIPSSITIIGESAFAESNFTEITLPANIDSIGPTAFYNCSKLESVTLPENLRIIADSAFHLNYSLKYIVIPDNVISIGEEAFSRCWGLSGLIIGMNIKKIGNKAFTETRISGLYNRNPVPQVIEGSGLESLSYSAILHVPKGSLNLYKNSISWSKFYTITEDEYIVANDNVAKENIIISNTANGINVSSSSPATVIVYSISGQMVYKQHMRDRLDIQLKRGLYIVKVGDITKKVFVK